VPPEVEDAIIKSLNLNMHHRQQSVKEFAMALSGIDSLEFSRPIWSEEQSQRTQALDRSTENVHSKPTGLKLPTGRSTAAPGQAPSMRIPQPMPQRRLILPLAGITILLAALVTAVYYYFTKSPESLETTPPPALTETIQPTQSITPPIPQQVSPPPAQPVATPTPADSPMPVQPQTPAPTTTITSRPSAESGSAQEMLRNRVVEPEPLAPAPASTVSLQPKPRPKPKPKPPVNPSVERSNPKPSGNSEPSWVIIPGGARKTD
jgi:hypothetical protein